MQKYPETMTLKEVKKREEIKTTGLEKFKNARLKKVKEKYEGKCLKLIYNFFDEEIEFLKINEIVFDGWCDDFETFSFKVYAERTALKGYVYVDKIERILHSNVDYEIISEEKYDEAKAIVKDYLNKIKNI